MDRDELLRKSAMLEGELAFWNGMAASESDEVRRDLARRNAAQEQRLLDTLQRSLGELRASILAQEKTQ